MASRKAADAVTPLKVEGLASSDPAPLVAYLRVARSGRRPRAKVKPARAKA